MRSWRCGPGVGVEASSIGSGFLGFAGVDSGGVEVFVELHKGECRR
jgi:hypothetical protein